MNDRVRRSLYYGGPNWLINTGEIAIFCVQRGLWSLWSPVVIYKIYKIYKGRPSSDHRYWPFVWCLRRLSRLSGQSGQIWKSDWRLQGPVWRRRPSRLQTLRRRSDQLTVLGKVGTHIAIIAMRDDVGRTELTLPRAIPSTSITRLTTFWVRVD